MNFFIGSGNVSNVKIGSYQVDKIYLGSGIVWNFFPSGTTTTLAPTTTTLAPTTTTSTLPPSGTTTTLAPTTTTSTLPPSGTTTTLAPTTTTLAPTTTTIAPTTTTLAPTTTSTLPPSGTTTTTLAPTTTTTTLTPCFDIQSPLMLHFNGSNGSTVIKDSSYFPNIVTARDGGSLTTSDKVFGSASYTDGYVSVDTPSWNYGSNNFTIELWFKITNLYDGSTAVHGLFGHRDSDASYGVMAVVDKMDGKIKLFVPNADFISWSPIFASDTNLSIIQNSWHHFALVRYNDNLYSYLDGSAGNSFVLNWSLGATNGSFNVGSYANDDVYSPVYGRSVLTGFIDECRVTMAALYNGPFVVPSAQLLPCVTTTTTSTTTTTTSQPVTTTLPPPSSGTLSYMVAGGGGGGTGRGGGGGGGGFRQGSDYAINTNTPYTVTIGAGGAGLTGDIGTPGGNGSSSTFDTIISAGGGGGGSWGSTPYDVSLMTGQDGGCGGGGGAGWYTYGPGGAGNTPSTYPSQGFSGGSGFSTYDASVESCGGGGGAGGAGQNGDVMSGYGGQGGMGANSSISGVLSYLCGGGGGGANPGVQAGNGTDGGGNGNSNGNAYDGTVNTGGGGGGTTYYNYYSGNGGAGVVVLRFPSSYNLSVGPGLTYTSFIDGSDYVYVFTDGSDSITFTSV